MTGDFVGLLRQYVPAAVVVRQAVDSRGYSSQNYQRSPRGGSVEQDLDSGHVFSEREAGHVSRSDRQQPAGTTQQDRLCVVRHQVSISGTFEHFLHCINVHFVIINMLKLMCNCCL